MEDDAAGDDDEFRVVYEEETPRVVPFRAPTPVDSEPDEWAVLDGGTQAEAESQALGASEGPGQEDGATAAAAGVDSPPQQAPSQRPSVRSEPPPVRSARGSRSGSKRGSKDRRDPRSRPDADAPSTLGEEAAQALALQSNALGPLAQRTQVRALLRVLQASRFLETARADVLAIMAGECRLVERSAGSPLLTEDDEGLDTLFVLLSGAAEWRTSEGEPLGEVAPCDAFACPRGGAEVGEADLLGAPAGAVWAYAWTPVRLAAFPLPAAVRAGLETSSRRQAQFEEAFSGASTEAAIRSSDEVAAIARYLRWHESLRDLPGDVLAALARHLVIQEFVPGAVMSLAADSPPQLLIVLHGAVSAWRRLPISAAAETAECIHPLREEQARAARSAIGAAEARAAGAAPPPPATVERGGRLGPRATLFALQEGNQIGTDLICTDYVGRDRIVRFQEWALAHGCACGAALVAHAGPAAGPLGGRLGSSSGTSPPRLVCMGISRGAYIRYVQPHRAAAVRLETALFVATCFPPSCRVPADVDWLRETPLAQGSLFRALPRQIRNRVLRNSRLRRVARGACLFEEGDLMDAAGVVLRGRLRLCRREALARVFGGRRRSWRYQAWRACLQAARVLSKGDVLGEVALAAGAAANRWPQCGVAEDDCDVLEVRREEVAEAAQSVFQQEASAVITSIPLQGLERLLEVLRTSKPESRSVQELQPLSEFLRLYHDFSELDSQICIELCQGLQFLTLEAGEPLVQDGTQNAFCVVLSGEVGIFAQRTDGEVLVLAVPKWAVACDIRPAEEEPGQQILRALCPSQVLCLYQEHYAQVLKRLAQSSMERLRALHALKHKVPEDRTDDDITALEKLLLTSPFYGQLEVTVRREVCRSMTWQLFPPLTPIIRQGDEAKQCFVLLRGTVSLWISAGDEESGSAQGEGGVPSDGGHGEADEDAMGPILSAAGLPPKSVGSPKAKSTGTPSPPTPVAASHRSTMANEPRPAVNKDGGDFPVPKRGNLKEWMETSTPLHRATSPDGGGQAADAFLTQPRQGPAGDDVEGLHESASFNLYPGGIDPETGGPPDCRMVKILEEGACFGEAGLLHSETRNATIVARQDCECGVIQKQVFDRILRAHFMREEEKRVDFLRQHLPRGQSGADYSQKVARFFVKQFATRGAALCRQGRPAPKLWLIREGWCKVYHTRDNCPPQEVGELGVGHCIGSSSTVLGLPVERFSIVVASCKVELLGVETSEVKIRLPADMRKAFADVEQERLARFDLRAAALGAMASPDIDALVEAEDTATKPQLPEHKWFGEGEVWMESPFLRNKKEALVRDVSKVALLLSLHDDLPVPSKLHRARPQPQPHPHGAEQGKAADDAPDRPFVDLKPDRPPKAATRPTKVIRRPVTASNWMAPRHNWKQLYKEGLMEQRRKQDQQALALTPPPLQQLQQQPRPLTPPRRSSPRSPRAAARPPTPRVTPRARRPATAPAVRPTTPSGQSPRSAQRPPGARLQAFGRRSVLDRESTLPMMVRSYYAGRPLSPSGRRETLRSTSPPPGDLLPPNPPTRPESPRMTQESPTHRSSTGGRQLAESLAIVGNTGRLTNRPSYVQSGSMRTGAASQRETWVGERRPTGPGTITSLPSRHIEADMMLSVGGRSSEDSSSQSQSRSELSLWGPDTRLRPMPSQLEPEPEGDESEAESLVTSPIGCSMQRSGLFSQEEVVAMVPRRTSTFLNFTGLFSARQTEVPVDPVESALALARAEEQKQGRKAIRVPGSIRNHRMMHQRGGARLGKVATATPQPERPDTTSAPITAVPDKEPEGPVELWSRGIQTDAIVRAYARPQTAKRLTASLVEGTTSAATARARQELQEIWRLIGR